MFEASQLKGCTITTFPDQNKILAQLGFAVEDPPDEVWTQVQCVTHAHNLVNMFRSTLQRVQLLTPCSPVSVMCLQQAWVFAHNHSSRGLRHIDGPPLAGHAHGRPQKLAGIKD